MAESPFEVLHRAIGHSPALQGIYRDAFGAQWPGLAHQTSFVTQGELSILVEGLQLGAGAHLVDLGCGAGGPGLWIADASGATVFGLDSSAAAVAAAQRAASDREGAAYRVADMTATGLSDSSFEGAVSIDALQLLSDPRRGVAEAARLLAPGRRFAFTTWEASPPAGAPPQAMARFIEDYRPVLEACGFEVVHHSIPDGWKQRQLAVARGVLAQQEILTEQMGGAAYALLSAEARQDPQWLEASRARRVVVVGERAGVGPGLV